jgi:hypothetical protein
MILMTRVRVSDAPVFGKEELYGGKGRLSGMAGRTKLNLSGLSRLSGFPLPNA